ncbi:altronate hydrolase [Sphingomonas gilva]|uniref:Altronate hydrolase n=1 Tax=Sphingomonas gilva TaxID=2305907 RepID=A0A396RQP3_9SPHN|nr:UxaA family hydrolase [Sphingomonas gilva]RHW18934.1 altronate hydrolase [Sphingomonas gilva]
MIHEARLMLLDPRDTILVCIAPVAAGDSVTIEGVALSAPDPIGVGHKVARRALAPGDKVVKYGAPIGSITRATAPGALVHLHNMKSDYIASHSRDAVSEGKG